MLIMFGIEGPEGMASSDCLMANQIAWLGKYPCFEQDGCNISYHCSIGLIFWYNGLTGVPEGTKYWHFQCDQYIRCNLYYKHTKFSFQTLEPNTSHIKNTGIWCPLVHL
jgi:hypothetical protein